jgi:uncharacterized membrane protein
MRYGGNGRRVWSPPRSPHEGSTKPPSTSAVDHLSATIHTLVLAYAGASLPLLLITHSSGVGFTDAISTQDIAQPVIAALVGCIALVCAVPLTTGLAALLVARVSVHALENVHAHAH